MKWLLCLLLGHGEEIMHQDGRGAAWTTCARCGNVISSWSWHGDKPGEQP